MNKQPTEILLLFTDYLDNRDSISFLRLSSSIWSSHRSPAGRYRLKSNEDGKIFTRPSSFSSFSLLPFRCSPYNGHYLLKNLILKDFDDFALFFPESKEISSSQRKSAEIPEILKKVHQVRIDLDSLKELPEARRNRKFPDSIEEFSFWDSQGDPLTGLMEFLPTGLKKLDATEYYNDGHIETVDFSRFPYLEELKLGNSIDFPLRPGVFPPSLRKFHYEGEFNDKQFDRILPDSLEELFLSHYNQPLSNRLPSGLKVLKLISTFDQPIGCGQLPRGLKILHLSVTFDHPIELNCLPIGLEELNFSTTSFSHPLLPGVFPNSLKRLVFDHFTCYSHPIPPGVLPESLETLELCLGQKYSYPCPPLPIGLKSLKIECLLPEDFLNLSQLRSLRLEKSFNSSMARGIFPPSLTDLHLGFQFNEPLVEGFFPVGLKKLYLGVSYNQILPVGIFPSSLEEIEFGRWFIQPLEVGIFSEGLKKIIFSSPEFNEPLWPGLFPPSVEEIEFGEKSQYNYPLFLGTLPIGLRKIRFGRFYNQKLPVGIFPQGMHTIELGSGFSHRLEAGLFPSSVRKLKISTAHPLPRGLFPEGIEEIEFEKFNLLLPGLFPSSLRRLKFRNFFSQDILPGVLPEFLCDLDLGHFLGYFPLSALPIYFRPDFPPKKLQGPQCLKVPNHFPDRFIGHAQLLISHLGENRLFLQNSLRLPLSSNEIFSFAEPIDGGESFIISHQLFHQS